MSTSYLDLEPGERRILTARRHWIAFFPLVVSTVLLLAFASYGLGWVAANPTRLAGIPVGVVALFLTSLAGLAIIILIIAYLIHIQNRIILTNRYYIQITQTGLFGRTVSKLTLDEIQDVRGTKRGFFPTILNYGEMLIETAGEEENFRFRPVGNPFEIAEQINDAHQHFSPTHHPGSPSQPATTPPASIPPA
jgi:hypothetical protein